MRATKRSPALGSPSPPPPTDRLLMFSRFAAGLLPTAISLAVLVPVASAADAPPPPSGPVVDRTTFTTTTREEGGVYRTRAFPEPVNFKADGQEWRAIDRTLEREADGTVRPVAVDGDAAIPRTLDEPLLLEHDGRRLTFRLMGVDDDIRETSGSKAEFDAAIPDVDVTYRARAFGLTETIVLQSKAARRSFSYDLRADDDLTGEIDHRGDLIFTDGSGNEQFRVSAPLAWDSGSPKSFSNALDLDVTKKSAGRWVLTMRADDEWLDDPSRVYPVSLDPDFYWVGAAMRFHGAQQDCYLAGGSQAGTDRHSLVDNRRRRCQFRPEPDRTADHDPRVQLLVLLGRPASHRQRLDQGHPAELRAAAVDRPWRAVDGRIRLHLDRR